MQWDRKLNQAMYVATERWGACLWSRKSTGSKPLQDRGCGHVSLSGGGAQRRHSIRKRGTGRKTIGKAVRSGKEANKERVGWRNDGEIVHRSQILADAVNTIPASDRRGVMTAK